MRLRGISTPGFPRLSGGDAVRTVPLTQRRHVVNNRRRRQQPLPPTRLARIRRHLLDQPARTHARPRPTLSDAQRRASPPAPCVLDLRTRCEQSGHDYIRPHRRYWAHPSRGIPGGVTCTGLTTQIMRRTNYSGCIPASLANIAHLGISLWMNRLKSDGFIGAASTPMLARAAVTSALARALAVVS